jgi:predicted metal-dependent enzyme (double-stranded beta helix superfamily)
MTSLQSPRVEGLDTVCDLPPEAALPRAASFLNDMVKDPTLLESEILPLLGEARGKGAWYVARGYGGEDGSFSLKVFVWPPGTGTEVHDHSSWGVYHCVAGSVLEERYERLDDGSRPDHARLRKVWQLTWSPEDGPSTVLPGDGGIHRVANPFDETAVSVHLYGPRMGEVDGRDYDPARDHVCDRLEEDDNARTGRTEGETR